MGFGQWQQHQHLHNNQHLLVYKKFRKLKNNLLGMTSTENLAYNTQRYIPYKNSG
jgi:hypothetical protein